jgi:hypothetical protein
MPEMLAVSKALKLNFARNKIRASQTARTDCGGRGPWWLGRFSRRIPAMADHRPGDAEPALCAERRSRRPATGRCKHIDESSGRVFLNVNSLEQPRWSLENRRFSFGKVFNLFDLIPYAKNIRFTLARRRGPPLRLRQTNKNQHRGD